ncbi:MAG: hypothetical protein L3J93_00735 [Thermoplasmata archaeon]|nr:hypothetical protein [Thermoplasmata archaeon]
MSALGYLRRIWPILALRANRERLRGGGRRAIAAAIAFVVALTSMLAGGMLTLTPTQGVYTAEVITGGGPSGWWFYPEILIAQPWGYVQLPWLPTVAMLLVGIGAGIGAAVGLEIVIQWLRARASGRGATEIAGIAAGAGPGVASLATLGACCCTSCSSATGLALVAAASGTTVAHLFTVNWYLPVFQLAVVYVSLLAQERTLRLAAPGRGLADLRDPRFLGAASLRLALLIAGTTWSMAMFVEWGDVNPWTASAATWYHWGFEHQVLSLTAIAAALFPRELARFFSAGSRRVTRLGSRTFLALGALTWGVWVPPALTHLGLGGLLNELAGYLGLAPSWGAIPPDVPVGPALVFHWLFQHLLLSAFALALAASPSLAGRWLDEPKGAPSPGSFVSPSV